MMKNLVRGETHCKAGMMCDNINVEGYVLAGGVDAGVVDVVRILGIIMT
jgi:hypothetical protein